MTRPSPAGGNSTLEFDYTGPATFALPVSGIRGMLLKNIGGSVECSK